jgi:hypothetical protein
MGRLVVDVTHPTTRTDDTPFTPAVDLHHWLLFARAVGATNWTPVGGQNAAAVTTREIGNVPMGGDWEVKIEWYDQHNQMSMFTTTTDVPEPVPAPPRAGSATVTFFP